VILTLFAILLLLRFCIRFRERAMAAFAFGNRAYDCYPTGVVVRNWSRCTCSWPRSENSRARTSWHSRYFLINGALSFPLFAGALQIDLSALWTRKFTISLLATVGVAIATAMFGLGMWVVFDLTGIETPLLWCMVLGAVLAPTDPIAIAGIMAKVGLPKRLAAVLAGESLFNDGVGVVIFTAVLGLATAERIPSLPPVALELAREIGVGLLIGGVTGWIAYQMMRRLDQDALEIIFRLPSPPPHSLQQNAVGASGPIAVVVSGLLIILSPIPTSEIRTVLAIILRTGV
jgi:NhaP-type Na+/H+ or K+/H+ antiporter